MLTGLKALLCPLVACFLAVQSIQPALRPLEETESLTLWGNLKPGKHAVGFRVLFLSDTNRTFASNPGSQDSATAARQLRVFIWYPAKGGASRAAMRFDDYFETLAPSAEYEQLNEFLRTRDQRTLDRQFTQKNATELVAQLRAVPVAAVKDAAPARGRFSLVLHSLGRNDYQQESTVLWEYLASRGFVVAVVPQLGKSLSEPQLSFSVPDMQIQAADVEFAWGELAKLPFVDRKKTALLGHSSGGVVAAMITAKDRRIRALVSLDGSLSTPDGAKLLQEAGIDPRGITVPVLNLHKMTPRRSLEATFINAVGNARVVNIGFKPATHFDFQNWPTYSLMTTEEDERSKSVRPAAAGRAVFWSVCELTHHFLEATVMGEKRAWGELRSSPARLSIGDSVISEGAWQLP